MVEPLALTSAASISSSNQAVSSSNLFNPFLAPLPVAANATFATRYSGSQTAKTELRNSQYFLEDLTRGNGIETLNLNNSNAADTTGATSFTDADNNWTSAEYDNDDFDNAALDVHWALQEIYDFFEDEYSRSGWDSAGQQISAFVHALIYDGTQLTPDNAAYYGDDEYLAFGDGQNYFTPFVSLDAVAHEYAHGINDHTSGFGASGLVRSFNEALSDIWAVVIENSVAPGKNCWLIFEEITRNMDCTRNIKNPDDSMLLLKLLTPIIQQLIISIQKNIIEVGF